ncbi:hypothetical protein QCN27_03965 [Cereibacter sp. SYSU M97828]|nr:hypothetical protein [Cereibacter flavus]
MVKVIAFEAGALPAGVTEFADQTLPVEATGLLGSTSYRVFVEVGLVETGAVIAPDPMEVQFTGSEAKFDSTSVAGNRQRTIDFMSPKADGTSDYIVLRGFVAQHETSNTSSSSPATDTPNTSFRLAGGTVGAPAGETVAGSIALRSDGVVNKRNQHLLISKFDAPPAESTVASYYLASYQAGTVVAGFRLKNHDYDGITGHNSLTNTIEIANVPKGAAVFAIAGVYNSSTAFAWAGGLVVDASESGTAGVPIRFEIAHLENYSGGALTITAAGAMFVSAVVVPIGTDGEVPPPPDPGESFTAQNGDVTFTGTGVTGEGWGYTRDGQIGAASVPNGLVLTSVSPATTTENGKVKHGMQLDMNGRSQGLDQRSKGTDQNFFWDASKTAQLPLIVPRGSIVNKSVGMPGPFVEKNGEPNDTRAGIIKQHAAIIAADRIPGPNDFLAPVAANLRKLGVYYITVDVEAIVATLPNDVITGAPALDVEKLITHLEGKFNPVGGWMNSPLATSGYEVMMPHDLGIDRNYGQNLGELINTCLALLTMDLATFSQKVRIAVWLISMGIQTDGNSFTPDGGHFQWPSGPVIFKRWCCGEPINTLRLDQTGNYGEQFFLHTQRTLDEYYLPHSDPNKFHLSRRRTVLAVNGNSVTLNFNRDQGDEDVTGMNGVDLVKEGSSSVRARVTQVSVGFPDEVRNMDVPVALAAQPSTPFAIGDTVYMVPRYTMNINDPDWHIRYTLASMNSFGSPALNAKYRSLSNPSTFIYAMTRLGLLPSLFEPVKAYTEKVAAGNYPNAENQFPSVHGPIDGIYWIGSVWNANWSRVRDTPTKIAA